MKKKPRFFCDNCGYEVENDAKACPHCGRFFSSVRCPSCGFAGEEKLFINGCPSCGYSAAPGKQNRAKKSAQGTLPFRAYLLTGLILLIVISILAYVITR
ncbi:MAG: zinc ribbon domain-containing protein [Treponema sp.]|nr:zinc ribbon domain-containing protein [Treponema sp.]